MSSSILRITMTCPPGSAQTWWIKSKSEGIQHKRNTCPAPCMLPQGTEGFLFYSTLSYSCAPEAGAGVLWERWLLSYSLKKTKKQKTKETRSFTSPVSFNHSLLLWVFLFSGMKNMNSFWFPSTKCHFSMDLDWGKLFDSFPDPWNLTISVW